MLTDEFALFRFDGAFAFPSLTNRIDVDAGDRGEIAVPDAHLMFQGEYRKDGFDLVITDSDTQFTIHDYFRSGTRATLTSPEGAILSADVVAAMAVSDHGVRYAQASPAAAPAPIGRVETVSGQATAIRNGTPVALNQGDFVFKGDTVQTDRGSAIGITFIDGTTFSLQANARMVLNELVYQPGGTQNSALMNIVQGSVTFLAGQVAKTGDMKVGTPVATMGIRGTLVSADVDANNGATRFSVITESDGRTGRYDLLDRAGNVIASVSSPDRVITISPGSPPIEEAKTFAQQQTEQAIVAQVYQLFSLGQANPIVPGVGQPQPGAPGTDRPAGDTGPRGAAANGSSDQKSSNDASTSNPAPDRTDSQPQAKSTTPTEVTQTALAPAPPAAAATTTTQVPVVVVIAEQTPAKVVAVHIGSATAAAIQVADDGTATTVAGTYGTLAISPNGNEVYAALRTTSLPQDQQDKDVFVVDRLDPTTGQKTSQTISFTVTGENDAPTASAFRTSVDLTSTTGTGSRNLLADAQANDPDHFGTYNETALLKVSAAKAAADAAPTAVASSGTSTMTGLYGHLAIQADGTYRYVADQPAATALKQGETQTDTFSVTIVDPHGATATSTLSFDVAGKNDAPVVTALARTFDVSTGVSTVSLLTGASDPDHDAVLHIDVATLVWANAAGSGQGGLPPGFALAPDHLSIGVDTADAAYQALMHGQAVTQVLTFDVVDEFGARTPQTATFTIAGSNAAPVAVDDGPFAATQDGPAVVAGSRAGGVLGNDYDPDPNETASLVVTAGRYSGAGASGGGSSGTGGSYTSALVNGLGGTAGFGENTLPGNDDGSSTAIDITSIFGSGGINLFGTHFTSLYVNNNGNLTFTAPSSTFVPQQIQGTAGNPIIAPFWYDVDTRPGSTPVTTTPGGHSTGTDLVYWDLDTTNHVFTATWDDVGYFSVGTDKPNAFQVQLISRGGGDFDIVYRYESTSYGGNPSSSTSGARAGYSGGGQGANSYELPQSGDPAAMATLDTVRGNTGQIGVDVFTVRSGSVSGGDVAVTNGSATIRGLYGTLTLNADGTYSYGADHAQALGQGVHGTDSFTYTISDPHNATAQASIAFDVAGVNDVPTAANASFANVVEDTPYQRTLPSAYDPDQGDTVTYGLGSGPAHGTVTIGASGSFTYNPAADFNGADSFTYTVSDGHPGGTNTYTANLTVVEANDAPIANADSKTAIQDTPLTFSASDLAANDGAGPANEAAQTLAITGVSRTADTHGTVMLSGGQVTYTPDQGYSGSASFSYVVQDNGTTDGASDPKSATGTVNLTVVATATTTLVVPDGQTRHVGDGGRVYAIQMQSTGNNADLTVGDGGTVTLQPGSIATLTDFPNNRIYTLSSGSVLDNAGSINGAGQIFSNVGLTLRNEAGGIVDGSAATNALTIHDIAVANRGVLQSTGAGGLRLASAVIDNAGGIIRASAAGGHVDLAGATIQGGSLTTANGGVLQAVGGTTTLDGSGSDAIHITNGSRVGIADGQSLHLAGAIENRGTIAADSVGGQTDLVVDGSARLTGGGTIALANAARLHGAASGATLDNVDDRIAGIGSIFGLGLTNEASGVIAAHGGLLSLTGISVTNMGLLVAEANSTLRIDNTTVANAGGIVRAKDASARVELTNGAVIQGGTVDPAGPATGAIYVTGPARLDGAANPLDITSNTTVVIEDGQALTIAGAIANSGVISAASAGGPTLLRIDGPTTLSGGGSVTLAGDSQLAGAAANSVLTNHDETIGGVGRIISGSGLRLVNEATGTIQSDGGSLSIEVTITNAGRLQAQTGSSLEIHGPGLANLSAGTLTGGTYAVSNGATFHIFDQTVGLSTLSADLSLGSGSSLLTQVNGGDVAIEQSLTTISSGAHLSLFDHTATWSQAITVYGTLNLNGGVFTDFAGLTIASGGGSGGSGRIAGTLVNDGVVIVNDPNGPYVATAAVAGTGYFVVSDGSTLEFDASVASGVLVKFSTASAGNLRLGDIANFAGTISDFGDDDGIDLLGLTGIHVVLADAHHVQVLDSSNNLRGTLVSSDSIGNSSVFSTASDGNGGTFVTVTRGPDGTPGNHPPTGISLSNTAVAENGAGAVVGTLATSDPDQGDTFAYGPPSDARFEVVNGQLKLKAGLSLDHETEPTVNLSVTVTDSGSATYTQGFAIAVTDVNEAPTATGTPSGSGAEGSGAFTVNLVQGASDPDNDTLHVKAGTLVRTDGNSGALPPGVTQSGDTLRIDTSDPAFNHLALNGTPFTASFGYDVTDPSGLTVHRTANVTITGTNDAPTAATGHVDTNEDASVTGMLPSASDPDDGDTITYSVAHDAQYGTVTLTNAATGAFTYAPVANFHGPDTFHYTVTDAAGASSTYTETVTVVSVNDPPTALNDTLAAIAEDSGPYAIPFSSLTANDSAGPTEIGANNSGANEGGQSITVTSVGNAVGGTVAIQNGVVVFTPTANYSGAASFDYTITDDGTTNGVPDPQSATATASFQITPDNAPVATDDGPYPITATPGGSPVVAGTRMTGLLGNDTDPDPGETASLFVTAGHYSGTGSVPVAGGGSYTNALVNGLGGAAGFGESTLPGNDDGSSTAIDITSLFGPQGLNLFGTYFTSLYVNNNGNLTFTSASSTFTPQPIQGTAGNPIIAPFWYDADTRGGAVAATPGGNSTGTDLVYWDLDTSPGSQFGVFTATWNDVGYYSAGTDRPNAFQVQLISRGGGDFDIVYRYENINYGGNPSSSTSGARAGYSGGGQGANSYELPQSGDPVAMADLDTIAGNTGAIGVDVFTVRSGSVSGADIPVTNGSATIGGLYGTLTLHNDGTYSYAADHAQSLAAGIHGTDAFTYTVSDVHSLTDQAQVTFDVTGVNDAPTAPATRSVSTTEDLPTAATAIGALDPDGDSLTYTVLSTARPSFGSVSFSSGTFTYTPDPNANGTDNFTILIDDGHGGTTQQAVTVAVSPVNDAPVASGDTLGSIPQNGGAYTIPFSTLTANDSAGPANEANQTIAVTSVANAVGGTVSIQNGAVVFTPTANYSGPASFDYTITDDGTTDGQPDPRSATATASFQITGSGNNPPVIASGAANVSDPETNAAIQHGGAVTFSDPDQGDTATAAVGAIRFEVLTSAGTTTAQYASSVIGFSSQYSTGSWSAEQALGAPNTNSYGDIVTAYSPLSRDGTSEYLAVGFAQPMYSTGASIRETDGNGFVTQIDAIDTAGVAHTVWTGTDPSLPGAPAAFEATWARTTYLTAGLKIYIDTNHSGDWEEIDSVLLRDGPALSAAAAGAAGNAFTIQQGGAWTFNLPSPDYLAQGDVLTATYKVTVTDNHGATTGQDQVFRIQGTNDAPTAAATNSVSTTEDLSAAATAIGAVDPDGDNLTYSVLSTARPSFGSVSFSSGTFTYAPDPNANGTDHFTIVIDDGRGGSAQQAVTVAVGEVNDAPIAVADSKTAAKDVALTFAASDLLANDAAGPANELTQHLTVTSVTGDAGTHGTVTLSGGQITYTPASGYSGSASFTYVVQDDGTTGGQPDPKSATGTVNLSVSATIDGTAGADDLAGTAGPDHFRAFAGNDIMTPLGGDDLLEGGSGIDLARYDGETAAINVVLSTGAVSGASTGNDTLVSVERVRGTSAADTYDARGFVSPDVESPGVGRTFNEFEGGGSDDTIIGNIRRARAMSTRRMASPST